MRADSCVTATCHQQIGGLKLPHSPVKEGDCSSCHKQTTREHPAKSGKSFVLQATGAALCNQCHEPFGKKKVVHPPVKDGECLSCHKPHGSANRFLLEVGEDQSGLCLGCHDSAPFKQKFLHGPAAVGECTKCHNPHESAEKSLLTGKVRDVCLKCHADFALALKNAVVVHPPVKDDPCTVCHNPHGAAVAWLLKSKMPDICVGCHKDFGKKLTSVKVPHKPLLQPGVCGNCHSTHFAKAKGLLPSDEMTVCLGCHGVDNLGTPPLRNIAKEIAKKKFLHGPLQKGKCTACHDPHGSNYFRMLRGAYPSVLYIPYRDGLYGACLTCHDKNLCRTPETTTATGFRNGSRNLHFVHVANKRKGRSCRICHEPHASNGVKLIRTEGVPFGDWKIPIDFKPDATGGSCTPGCHKMFRYDRNKPVKY